jgi:hypothetical protein
MNANDKLVFLCLYIHRPISRNRNYSAILATLQIAG